MAGSVTYPPEALPYPARAFVVESSDSVTLETHECTPYSAPALGRSDTACGGTLARELPFFPPMTTHPRDRINRAPDSEGDLLPRLVHDLKNPLSALVSFAEEIPGADESDRTDFCKRLVSNAHRAVQLLDEFALVSDLRSSRLAAHAGECDWGAVVSQAVADALLAANAARGRIVSNGSAEIACTDGLLLQRAVCGLVREALRRTCEQEPVTVEVRTDAEHAALRLTVPQSCDCRPGGFRFDPRSLGVELAWRVARMLGGALEFESAGAGVVATLCVPRMLPAPGAAPDHAVLVREAAADA